MKYAQRLHRYTRQFLALAAMLLLSLTGSALAGTPPAPPTPSPSTACGGYPCGVSRSELLQSLLRSGTYTTVTQAMEFVSTYFQAGFGRQASAPTGTRFALSGQGETGKGAAAGEPASWNGWISGARANVGTSFSPLKSDGSVKAAMLGVDYTFSNKAIFGIALADSRARIDTKFNGGHFNADGLTVSPYLLYPLNSNWAVNAGMGFGRSNLKSFDNTNGLAITGRNESDTTLANIGLEYNRIMGQWAFTGRALATAYRDKQSSQTLSNNTFVPGSTNTATQLRFGGEVAYKTGAFLPYAGLTYVRDMHLPEQSAVAGQTPSNDRNSLQASLGLQYQSAGALYGGIHLSTERGRSQFKNDTAMINLGIHF